MYLSHYRHLMYFLWVNIGIYCSYFVTWLWRTFGKMEKMSIDDDYDLSVHSLPFEVLVHIFEFLPLKDRRNARLACHLWYDCCARSSITRNEKFVFRPDLFGLQSIADTLVTTKSLQLNLEFYDLSISSLPAEIWQVFGHRVFSLKFWGCQWNDETVANIILHSVNLIKFEIFAKVRGDDIHKVVYTWKFAVGNVKDGVEFCSPEVLTKLFEMGVKRTKLRTFALHTKRTLLRNSELEKIFLVYPNIECFKTDIINHDHLEQLTMISTLNKCLNSCTQLESLWFNYPTDGRWMMKCADEKNAFMKPKPDPRFNRLACFGSVFSYTNSLRKNLLDFFILRQNLLVVDLYILGDNGPEFMREVTFKILENCPNLLDFYFTFDTVLHEDETSACVRLKWDELPRFFHLISKLECLKLSFNIIESGKPSPEVVKSLSSKNLNLISLRIDHHDINEEFFAILCKHCSSLKYLGLRDTISNDKLQIIFQYLLDLRTLILKNTSKRVPNVGDSGFNGRKGGYSIKRLQRLEHLDIRSTLFKVTENFLLELQLPCLQFLRVDLDGLYEFLSESVLARFASNLPELRVLFIDGKIHGGVPMRNFLKHLKNLHSITIDHYIFRSDFDHKKKLQMFFEVCPSLRYFIAQAPAYRRTYFFNPFTKKVQIVKNNAFPDNLNSRLSL